MNETKLDVFDLYFSQIYHIYMRGWAGIGSVFRHFPPVSLQFKGTTFQKFPFVLGQGGVVFTEKQELFNLYCN